MIENLGSKQMQSGQIHELQGPVFSFLFPTSHFTPYIQTSIEPVVRLVVVFVGLQTPMLLA